MSEETQKETVEQTENKKQKAPKRVVISISVTPEEKRKISVEALKDYETSVSDLIRSRMFIKPEEPKESEDTSTEEENEIDIYKEVIQDLKNEISELKESNLQLKLNENASTNEEIEDEKEIIKPTVPKENILFIEFKQDEDEKSIIQKIKEYRSELFEKLDPKLIEDFSDFDKFSKIIFLRGLKRSYNNGILNESTGLYISDIQKASKLEQIDYSEEV